MRRIVIIFFSCSVLVDIATKLRGFSSDTFPKESISSLSCLFFLLYLKIFKDTWHRMSSCEPLKQRFIFSLFGFFWKKISLYPSLQRCGLSGFLLGKTISDRKLVLPTTVI